MRLGVLVLVLMLVLVLVLVLIGGLGGMPFWLRCC